MGGGRSLHKSPVLPLRRCLPSHNRFNRAAWRGSNRSRNLHNAAALSEAAGSCSDNTTEPWETNGRAVRLHQNAVFVLPPSVRFPKQLIWATAHPDGHLSVRGSWSLHAMPDHQLQVLHPPLKDCGQSVSPPVCNLAGRCRRLTQLQPIASEP